MAKISSGQVLYILTLEEARRNRVGPLWCQARAAHPPDEEDLKSERNYHWVDAEVVIRASGCWPDYLVLCRACAGAAALEIIDALEAICG